MRRRQLTMAVDRALKTRLRSAKGRRATSTRWLSRQLNDRFVRSAQEKGYRSRAAYKLLEIDAKFRLLRAGRSVLDLGSAPGGWAQVAAAQGCRVVGVDLLEIDPIAGVVMLQGDLFEAATIDRVLAITGGPVEVLLSDLATSSTGQRTVDRLRAEGLAEAVLAVLPNLLARNGHLVLKLLRGAEANVGDFARRRFAKVKLMRPEATRRESSEIYLVGQGYRGDPAGGGNEQHSGE
jgi:23S rRNA (uridine2552-2'-O)-methyltransferase